MIQGLKERVRRLFLAPFDKMVEDFAVNSGGNYSRDFIDMVLNVLLEGADVRKGIEKQLEAVRKDDDKSSK